MLMMVCMIFIVISFVITLIFTLVIPERSHYHCHLYNYLQNPHYLKDDDRIGEDSIDPTELLKELGNLEV